MIMSLTFLAAKFATVGIPWNLIKTWKCFSFKRRLSSYYLRLSLSFGVTDWYEFGSTEWKDKYPNCIRLGFFSSIFHIESCELELVPPNVHLLPPETIGTVCTALNCNHTHSHRSYSNTGLIKKTIGRSCWTSVLSHSSQTHLGDAISYALACSTFYCSCCQTGLFNCVFFCFCCLIASTKKKQLLGGLLSLTGLERGAERLQTELLWHCIYNNNFC